ncbi:hypothetical protein KA017_02160 [Candidatus Woesebacteria bacterium]|nr:hypothetical protein [Candidatus Woesebacteria bacterium]
MKDKFPTHLIEISWEKATGLVAHELIKAFKQEMGKQANRLFSGEVEGVYSPNDWFSFILGEKCNVADLARFSAHGITKGKEEIQLQALLAILTTQEIKGDWAPMSGSGYANAYTHGSFILIAPIDESLKIDEKTLNIGVVVVNPYFVPLIPTLKKNFPNFSFIKAEEFPKWVEDQKKK